MPICSWCRLDSDDPTTCVWCRRPMAGRPVAYDGSRGSFHYLAEDEGDKPSILPLLGAAAGAVGLALAATLLIPATTAPMDHKPLPKPSSKTAGLADAARFWADSANEAGKTDSQGTSAVVAAMPPPTATTQWSTGATQPSYSGAYPPKNGVLGASSSGMAMRDASDSSIPYVESATFSFVPQEFGSSVSGEVFFANVNSWPMEEMKFWLSADGIIQPLRIVGKPTAASRAVTRFVLKAEDVDPALAKAQTRVLEYLGKINGEIVRGSADLTPPKR